MRLKDRFLTHGGLALWSRKHKWCGCLSVPLCCCSLPPLYSSLHCTLCPCHSLLSFRLLPPPICRTAGARGLSDGFHGYWLQRLDTSSQLPVVVRQPDIKPGAFFLLRPSLLRLVHQCLVYRLLLSSFLFFVNFLFLPNPRGDMRHNWSQITWITVIPSVISPSQINLLNAIGTAAPPINTLIRKSVEDGGDQSCPKCHSLCVTYKTMRGETFHPSTKQKRECTCPPITLSPFLYEGLRRFGSILS